MGVSSFCAAFGVLLLQSVLPSYHARPCSGMSEKWIDLGGNYCYLIEQELKLTWMGAVRQCFLHGGSLATLETMQEITRIQDSLKGPKGRVYIGLWKVNDGSFEWVDKSTSRFRNWALKEPNDRSETCVELFLGDGKWNDAHCDNSNGFICSVLKSKIAPATSEVCPNSSSEWRDYGTKYCYIIGRYDRKTSNEAAQRCSAAGGSLASFHSVEEISVIRYDIGDGRYHIGIRQQSNGMFEWMDRSPFDLYFWGPEEPNSWSERCGEMFQGTGRWNDINCDRMQEYICSTPKVNPEISATESSPEDESCGGDIVAENGTMHSPNYPENYSPNQTCFWKITVPENFQIELIFKVFQLEYEPGCKYDYVEILDGNEPDSTALRRLCGWNAGQIVLSSGNQMTVKFSSDKVNQRSGFFAEFKKVASCGETIVAEEGVIESRNYPDKYVPNEICVWKITVPDGNAVRLKFVSFEIESGGSCANDYVEVFDGHDTTSSSLGRYCGGDVGREILSSGHKLTVRFVSDDTKEYSGFLAEFRKDDVITSFQPMAPGLSGLLQESEQEEACKSAIDYDNGFLVSPHFPENYNQNEKCTWTIIGPPGSKINLRFKMFDVQSSYACSSDYVEVYDGPDVFSTSLETFCNGREPRRITSSSGNQMTVHFRSNYFIQERGFTATFNTSEGKPRGPDSLQQEQACVEHLSSDEGIIQSPNYPATYGPNQLCSWTITVPDGYRVILKFNDFQVETHVACAYDYVVVRDRHPPGSSVSNKFCGNEIPDEIRSSGNQLLIEFKSDSSGEYKGFSAEFKKDLPVGPSGMPEMESGACGGDIHAENGTIKSPNYPLPYGPLANCIWTITVPENNLVYLKFETIDLEENIYCSFDYITVFDGDNADSPILGRTCQYLLKFLSSTNKLTVKFTSDDSFGRSGFTATFGKVLLCGEDIVADEGVLQGPNITAAGYQCSWSITVPENYTVIMKTRKAMRTLYNKEKFYLKVHDGPDESSRQMGNTLNDMNRKYRFYSKSNKIFVKIGSDGSEEMRHFYAKFRKYTCGGDIVADNGTITSPNFPNDYETGQDCTWRITVPENYQVFLSFDVVDMGFFSCRSDFVEVRDGHSSDSEVLGKVCERNKPLILYSSSNQMSLKFVSGDFNHDYLGFSARFEKGVLYPCGGNITTERGTISSPNFPGNYPKHAFCVWKITAPKDYKVNLQFKSVSLESSDNCTHDFISVLDGHNLRDSFRLKTFCGEDVPELIDYWGNEMSVVFVSDGSTEGKGFTVDFVAVPIPDLNAED